MHGLRQPAACSKSPGGLRSLAGADWKRSFQSTTGGTLRARAGWKDGGRPRGGPETFWRERGGPVRCRFGRLL